MGDGVSTEAGSRSLKTAATVLRALRLLGDHPAGLCAAELGEHLGKSAATARYMINTLCEAGCAERHRGGRVRLTEAPPWGRWGGVHGGNPSPVPGDPDPGAALAEATTELYRRTRQRSYLVRRTGTLVATVTDSRGHQGLAKLPGLGTHVPPHHAHALAMTKVLLATSPAYREAVEAEPLTRLTPATITDHARLHAELERVRRDGVAVDREEWAEGLATVAAPVASPSGALTVALGLSCSARRLAADHDEILDAVLTVARRAGVQWASEGGLVAATTAAPPGTAPPGRPDGTVEGAVGGEEDDEDHLVSGPRR